MENKKDIGKAIKDKLNTLDKMPSDTVWTNISATIETNKKTKLRKIIYWSTSIVLILLCSIVLLIQTDNIAKFKTESTVNISKNNVQANNTIKNTNKDSINFRKSNDPNTTNKNKENTNETSKENINNKSFVRTTNGGNGATNKQNAGIKKNRSAEINGDKNNLLHNNTEKFTKTDYEKDSKVNKNAIKRSNIINNKTTLALTKLNRKGENTIFVTPSTKNKQNSFTELVSKNTRKTRISKTKNKIAKKEVNSNNAYQDEDKTPNKITEIKPSNSNIEKLPSKLKNKEKDSIAEKDKTITAFMYPEDKIKKDSITVPKKFDLDIFASPNVNNYFSTESIIDSRLNSFSKKSEVNLSYGIGITYAYSEKISIRFGLSNINLNTITKTAPIKARNYDGIIYNEIVSNETILLAATALATNKKEPTSMDIIHHISYIEIPMSIKYKFIDKQIGLKSSVGFSYLFLNENKVNIITNSGYQQEIGKIKNISKNSYSINAGIELDYKVFNNATIFMEPMLQYQLKAFSDKMVNNSIFGLRIGLRYSLNND